MRWRDVRAPGVRVPAVSVGQTYVARKRVGSSLAEAGGVTLAELVGALRRQQGLRDLGRSPQPGPEVEAVPTPATCGRVDVVGAHRAAGSTTVAVALGDALATTQDHAGGAETVTVVGDATLSPGLAAASRCEVGTHAPGWGAGRRGVVALRWRTEPSGALEAPVDVASGWTVTDVGPWLLDSASSRCMSQPGLVVLVCRATVPGVRAAEVRLACTGRVDAVIVVGARRWPREVGACLGPRLRDLGSSGRVVLMPMHRQLLLGGLDERPLPRCVTRAAGATLRMLRPARVEFSSAGRGRGRV